MQGRVLLFCLFILSTSCFLIDQKIDIEVPSGYIGWVYVIPVKDTSGLDIQKVGGRYQINHNGVAYVPVSVLDIKKDSRVLAFEGSKDISADMRYAGSVYAVKDSGNEYEYIQFYFPSLKERKIADADEYWRNKSWEYRSKFDSLLETDSIVFK
ncbi:hypothetical protein Q0590_36890 [Rhodocytophaga aerolata]|uniref:DUF4468 domain-containing protein n=2 Tax=Rhodocytophaga aerolata TaxID=455078 RepID=A0ABT8RIJ3_9BACT|nr:hypothetical protein [Rhodocytophaga aerolata]